MTRLQEQLGEYEPTSWCVVFNTEGASGWASWVPGRFKHVRAYAFIPKTRTWLFYDVNFGGTEIMAIPDGPEARAAIWSFIGPEGKSHIVSVPRLPRRRRLVPWSNWCTSALRHLLNLPGSALRPDTFYRECLDNGGTPFEADDGSAEVRIPAP
jgi:hypothetical protein